MSIDSNLALRLKGYNQTHLLAYWDELDHEQRAILLRDIEKTDLEHVTHAYETVKDQLGEKNETPIDELMQPIPSHRTASIDKTTKEQLETYRRQG